MKEVPPYAAAIPGFDPTAPKWTCYISITAFCGANPCQEFPNSDDYRAPALKTKVILRPEVTLQSLYQGEPAMGMSRSSLLAKVVERTHGGLVVLRCHNRFLVLVPLGHHTTVGVDMTVDEATSDQTNTNRHRRLWFATTC